MQAHDRHAMNIAERLRSLPAATPVADGWTMVQSRRDARQRTAARRVLAMRIAAAASIAVIAVTATWRVTEVTREQPAALAARITPLTAEEALALDRIAQLRTQGERPVVERAGTTLPIDTLEAQVQWIDHRISTAESAVEPGSIERLWRRRVEAMNSLVQLRYVEAQHIDM
jgi:hypothetical protein